MTENKGENFTEVCRLVAFGEFTHISHQLSCSPAVIIVNGAAPGCSRMQRCWLQIQHSGSEACVESFSRNPTWTFQGQKNESPNESYFHLRSPPRGDAEENSLSSFAIGVCVASVLLVIKACSVRERPLDNSSEILAWNWRIVRWHLVPAAGRASLC